jgi:hypothetical protein
VTTLWAVPVVAAIAAAATPAAPATQAMAPAAIDVGDNTPWAIPAVPPRCTTDRLATGNVEGCVVIGNIDPSEAGWGTPPAPGVGGGWRWSGYGYNGSPALVGWEAEFLDSNATTVAGLRPGRLRSHVAVAALFEGFLTEINAGGYGVADAAAYSFRCTDGSGGWSCPAGDRADLSNHAWGLAIDMNAATNPIRSYGRIDGVTACSTPVITDMPRWVIQTAEKWGLYWGGYGWSSGCATPTTERDSVFRDPPHFEFRGTVDQALRIAAFNGAGQRSMFCAEVVTHGGRDARMCNGLGRPGAGWRTPVALPAPAGARAVMVNLTATDATSGGYLTLEECTATPIGDRSTSNTNYDAGRDAANLAVAALGTPPASSMPATPRRLCVYRSSPTHSIVDVVGYVAEPAAQRTVRWFQPTSPVRLTDTRRGGWCRPGVACVPGRTAGGSLQSIPTSAIGTTANVAVTNITVTDALAPGFVTAARCDQLGGEISHSNVNYRAATAVANLAVVETGADGGACIYAQSDTHLVVDQVGTMRTDAGLGWSLVPGRRLVDTRGCAGATCGVRVPAMGVLRVPTGIASDGAVLNVTITGTDATGYATVGSCTTLVPGVEPATSTVNHDAGATVANMTFVDVDPTGDVCVFTFAAAHVIVDLQAELVTTRQLGTITITPVRADDTRQ